jgi:stage V sporulation protein B
MAKHGSFKRGTLVLSIAGFFNRVVGFAFNLYLIRLAGPEAIGLYRMVSPLYFTLLIVAGCGVPYALAKLVSEYAAQGDIRTPQRLLRLSFTLVLSVSVTISVLFLLASHRLATVLYQDPRVHLVIICLAPGLAIVALASIYRGYFQARQAMGIVAGAQIIEQLAHAGITILLITTLLGSSTSQIAAGMAVGMLAGELLGLLLLAGIFRCTGDRTPLGKATAPPSGTIPLLKRVMSLAGPVTAARLVAAGSSTVNLILIPARLRVGGLSLSAATADFGALTGIALPLIFFPNVVNLALATNLVPALSGEHARGDHPALRRRSALSLEMTYLLGLPVAICLILLAGPVAQVVYDYPAAEPLIAITAVGAVFAYLRQTSLGILHGLGRPGLAMVNYIIGVTADTALVWFLVARPEFGIKGAALASVANFTVGGLLNLCVVRRLLGPGSLPAPQRWGRPLPAAALLAGTVHFAHPLLVAHGLPAWAAIPVAAGGGLILYLGALVLQGILRPQEFWDRK